jgi:chromosome segregation ATPase
MAQPDKFRFHLGDDEPEAPAVDDALQRRVQKLGQRLSFVTLLLPCLLALVIYLAYREIDARVARSQAGDARAAERVAADLDQRASVLNERIATVEAALDGRLQAVQTALDGLRAEIGKGESALEALLAAKADKKELTDAAARIESEVASANKQIQSLAKDLQTLAPFREELGSAAAMRAEIGRLADRLQTLENSLGKELTGLAGFIERSRADMAQVKSELAAVQADRLQREYVDLEILKARKGQQTALEQEVSRIEKMLNTLQRRIDQLERAFSAPAGRTPPPAPGTIREQPVQ